MPMRRLRIQVADHDATSFVAAVDGVLPFGWRRHKAFESTAFAPSACWPAFYVRARLGQTPEALLAIFRQGKDRYCVAEAVSTEPAELTPEQRDAILLEFERDVLRKAKVEFPVNIVGAEG